ncbi:MAG TPA: glycosyltransferase family 39 protein [Pyrinomonadaceae bacterium]|nr:glycosyltransferase family 39 protein [Pyrinomonadaceae bacterium]
MSKKFVFILIFLHLAIAVPLALTLNIWVDEASTLYTTKSGFFQTFQNIFTDEKQAPLYFLILSLWRKLSDSVFFAQVFSMIFSVAAIFAFARLAKRIWEEKTAIFITAIFAFHPFLIWASFEIRVYSLLIFLSCLLFIFFYDGCLDDEIISRKGANAQRRAQIFYVLTAVVALYTHYYLGFVLVGAFFALLILRHFAAAKTYFMLMLAVGVAILPLFYIINLQFSDRISTFQEEKSFIEGARTLWNHFLTFVLPTEIYPTEEITIFSVFRLWIVRVAFLAALIVFVKNKFKVTDKIIVSFGTIFAVCAMFFLFVYFQLGVGYIETRHAAVFFVAVFVFASAVFVKILPRKSWIFVTVLYSIFSVYGIYALYPNLTKRGDWARIAEYIEKNETENQPIMMFQVYDAIALPVYYKGKNRILPDEKFFSFFIEAEAGSVESYRNQLEFIIKKIPPDVWEIWLLTNDKCEVKRTCEPLEKFIEANYTIIEEKDFYKEKIRLLRKK